MRSMPKMPVPSTPSVPRKHKNTPEPFRVAQHKREALLDQMIRDMMRRCGCR